MKRLNIHKKSLNLFMRFQSRKLVSVFLLTFLLAFSQGIGFLMLIPLLKLLDVSGASGNNMMFRLFIRIAEKTNIQPGIGFVLFLFVIILVFVYFLQNRKTFLQTEYQHRFAGFLRKDLYKRMLYSDWNLLTGLGKTAQLQAITSEITKTTHFYFYMLNAATRGLIVIVYFLFGIMISPQLTLVVLILCAAELLLFSRYLKKSYGLGKEGRKAFHRVLKNIDDFWVSMKPAKVHRTERFYFNKYAEADDTFVNNQTDQFNNNRKPQFFFNLLGVFNIVILFILSQQVFQIELSVFIVVLLLFSRMFPVLLALFNDVNLMLMNAESLNILEKYSIQFTSQVRKDIQPVDSKLVKGIRVEQVSFSYPEKTLLFKDLNLFISAGKMTGVVGMSGVGKTTIVDLICGLLKPQQGKIWFDDTVMNDNNQLGFSNNIAYLPQDSLFVDGTIRENLLWDTDAEVSDQQIETVLSSVNALDFFQDKSLSIDSVISNFRFVFSGGELQRLALARVLLRSPKLLILDEATSALDEHNENMIFDVLQSLKANTTIIFITHRKRLLQFFDEVIDLDEHKK